MKPDELVSVSTRLRSDPGPSMVRTQITRIEKGKAEAELTVVDYMLNFNYIAHNNVNFLGLT
jgi:hypothetical protein